MISKNLVIIGGGKMGISIADGLISQNCPPEKISIVEKSPEKLNEIKQKKPYKAGDKISLQSNDAILIAVKPYQFEDLKKELAPLIGENNLIISIMAGVSLKSLKSLHPQAKYIRVMPNTPAMVNKGITVYYGGEEVDSESREICENLFRQVGKVIRVNREDLIDAATAISGSGPAYAFYLAEFMKSAAGNLGFDDETADLLARETLLGASTLMSVSSEPIKTLRKNVTSPGGTTQAACEHFDTMKMDQIIHEGCVKAYERAKEISTGS